MKSPLICRSLFYASSLSAGSAGASSAIAIRRGVVLALLGLTAAAETGCKPTFTDPPDGPVSARDQRSTDGGLTTDGGVRIWSALADSLPWLQSEQRLSAETQWRDWKSDPSYLIDGGQQVLFFAGSPAAPLDAAAEKWSIGRTVAAVGTAPTEAAAEKLLAAGSGWDLDLQAPQVIKGAAALRRPWAMWYSANSAKDVPGYVTQIGVAFSDDGKSWDRQATPAIAAPFNGQGPTGPGPGAYGVGDPAVVVYSAGELWMYYSALDCDVSGCRFSILRSITQNGMTFSPGEVVLRGRQDVAAEAGGVAAPSVLQKDGKFLLAYTAIAKGPDKDPKSVRQALRAGTLGLAISDDGMVFSNASGTQPLLGLSRPYAVSGVFGPALYLGGADGLTVHLLYSQFSEGTTPLISVGHATVEK